MNLPSNRKASFDTICEFLEEQGTSIDRSRLIQKYARGLEWKGVPKDPDTYVDPVVVSIIETKKGKEAKEILETKKWITAVEGSIGYLLEKYIDSKVTDGKWIWCAGSMVKSTDFIKKTDSGWLQLQIKNRNNTENSSSSAIRTGTNIKMWFRFFCRTGKTNWDKLPGLMETDYGMNETDFQEFVYSLLKQNKPNNSHCLVNLLT